jgi:hypothetical protein
VSAFDPNVLRPGDVLTYSASDLWGRIIEWKAGSPTRSHVEVSIGLDQVFAARSGGVNYYPVRVDKYLQEVKRHVHWRKFNVVLAMHSVIDIVGKAYEIPGLFAFLNPWRKVRHLIKVCSPTAAHFLRGGGLEPFDPALPDNSIVPGDFVQSGLLQTVWANERRLMVERRRMG